jgi:para-aminobenzoate synthetase / 4-amino-4-deoxychorismate lyase
MVTSPLPRGGRRSLPTRPSSPVPDPVRCRFDEAGADGQRSVELTGLQDQVEAWTVPDVPGVLARAQAAASSGSYVAGFVSYEAAPAFDRALAVGTDPPSSSAPQLPLAWFGVFDTLHEVQPLSGPWSGASPDADGDPRADGQPGLPDRSPWVGEIGPGTHGRAVEAIRRAIAAGDTYLVNYTIRYRRPWASGEDPLALYGQLVSGHSSGFHGFIDTPDWAVACGSPELFFELRSGHVSTRPMKGTAPRGRWEEEDRLNAESLRTSPKERAENLMVVDLLRNDLGRIAVPGTVKVPELWAIERHPTVWQLTSTITATPRSGVDLSDVFAALFPCGSVTGAPKVSTMKVIADLEHSRRGVYCGAVGLLRPDRTVPAGSGGLEARFAVAIRTAAIDKGRGLVEYGSGGGITWDSSPASEWEEVVVKTKVVDPPAPVDGPPPALLETMAFDSSRTEDGDHGVRNLDRHLQRMASSAAYLGFPPPVGARAMVLDAVAGMPGSVRVRLILQMDGHLEVELHPLETEDHPGPLALCIDRVPVDSRDVGLFHKTTDRRRYDERTRRHPLADDVILVNERGEVTETTRANLLIRQDSQWITPPLDCGLLPGVGRARLLESGRVVERVVTKAELLVSDAVATVSSLRGWRPAQLQPVCRCCG